MKNISLSHITAFATSLVAIVFCATPSRAADVMPANALYWTNASGEVWRNSSGECWRTTSWTPALAGPPCDPGIQPAAAVVMPKAVAQVVPPAPAPAPVAAPVIAPVVVPLPQKVSFSGDALFAFDKSVLRPESRVLLDDLVGKLSGTSYELISVTGHTDRIGSPAYNQKLSERRATAVKDYLVGKDVQAARIEAKGMGETQPVTMATDCKGNRASASLIECLQPDRRVDVEMTGTKPGAAAK